MTQSQYSQARREALTDAIIDAKVRKNLTFEQINEGTGSALHSSPPRCSASIRCRPTPRRLWPTS
jgi:hypothetical protein